MGEVRKFRVHVYVWGKGGTAPRPKAPMILTYLREFHAESPGYWKTLEVKAESGSQAKQIAVKQSRHELKQLGLYAPLSRCGNGIKAVLAILKTAEAVRQSS